MSENAYKFDIPKHHKSIIKVIGVGGGGSNAVSHMYNQGIKDVEFVVCNTDLQSLKSTPVPTRLQIGANLTEGLGAGANPEKGRNAALESKDDIRQLLSDDTRMLFITAGMGGGTGTGAAPVIAKIANDLDVLTVGIVTVPFAFEGKKKMIQAQAGVQELKESCDTVLVILNDKLREIYGNLAISSAFAQADNVLTTAAKGIAEIITVPGYVNVDFQDVRTVMKNAGAAVMGSATTEGENRARRAAEEALASPLLNTRDIHGAQKILLSIMSGEQAELQMDELTEITEYIQEMTGDDAEVIFGHGIDPELEHSIRVTVITTGFENYDVDGDKEITSGTKIFDLETNRQISLFNGGIPSPTPVDESEFLEKESGTDDELSIQEQFERGYFFEPTASHNDAGEEVNDVEGNDREDKLLSELDEDFQVSEEISSNDLDEEGMVKFRGKKADLEKRARDRVDKLKTAKGGQELSDDELKEKLDVPAYLRKKVNLTSVPHSSEPNVSRYNLNDDNKLMGNNKFLHDNVD